MFKLGHVESVYSFFASNVVHSTLFPYRIIPSLHAARISVAFQNNARKTQTHGALSWGQHLVGFLIMSWSATIITHLLLFIPPPYLYDVHPWINYLTVHLIITTIFQLFPSALSPRLIDTLLFFPDAILRTSSVAFALELVQNHSDPRLSGSLLLRILIGAIASSGGGMTAATLGVWTPNWTFSTPVFLRKGTTALSTLDIWAGSLAGVVYGTLQVAHPAYRTVLTTLSVIDGEQVGPLVAPLSAKAASVVLLAVLFGWRAFQTHWAPAPPKEKSS